MYGRPVYLCYMDESGDPGDYAPGLGSPMPTYTVAAVLLHRRTAWRYALQRVERFAAYGHDTIMVLPDSGQYVWLRKLAREMRRHSVVGSAFGPSSLDRKLSRVLIDDPVERDSTQSYMIQLADLNAYAAFRFKVPIPQFPQYMWRDLGGAILTDANKLKRRQEPGIVEGP